MSSNLKVNTILPSSGNTVAVSGIVSATSSVSIGSSCTATNFYGSGANLTSLPAANLTGTLPAISGANLTNLPAANLTGTLPAISGANLTNLPVQASIASNANNRVITGGGGSNLVGEANLTFDDSHLILGSGKGIRTNYIRPTDGSNTNTGGSSQQYWKIGDISLNGSEAAEITLLGANGYSAGNTQVYGKTTIVLRGSNGNTLLGSWWVDGGEASHYSDVRWKHTSGTNYELWISAGNFNNIAPFVKTTGTFDNSNAAGTGTNNAPSGSTALQQTHYKSIGTIHTIQYTSTHTRFLQNIKMDSGKGIDFSAYSIAGDQGTSSSSVLDDFEEGSWTCTLSGTGGGSIQASTAGYTKVGNLVVCEASFINPGNNSVSGNWSMTLPFQFIGAGSGSYGGGQVTYTRYVPALTGGFQSYCIFTYYGQGSCYLRKLATNGSSETASHGGSVNNSMLFSFTMSYITGT